MPKLLEELNTVPGHMKVREVIAAINRMQAAGVIERYAIGGAVGAVFYLEPIATLDVDIFVRFRQSGSQLVTLEPILDYLKGEGYTMQGEYVMIGGWPVQFLPPGGPLGEEALVEAVERDVEGVSARVFTAEHLAAIALQTGRAKDKARLLAFIESNALDTAQFQDIVTRHALLPAWQRFERQFLQDQS